MSGSPSPSSADADQIRAATAAIKKALGATPAPAIGLVLGSGLSDMADELASAVSIPSASIPGFPLARGHGHRGSLSVGLLGGVRVACLAGRVHLYEGHPPSRVVFGVRVLAELGCRVVLLTNAAGGITSEFGP